MEIKNSGADGRPYHKEECPICKSCIDGGVCDVRGEVFWRKDGVSFPVSYVVTPMLEGGKLVGAVVTFKDITEVIKMEEELRRTKKNGRRTGTV